MQANQHFTMVLILHYQERRQGPRAQLIVLCYQCHEDIYNAQKPLQQKEADYAITRSTWPISTPSGVSYGRHGSSRDRNQQSLTNRTTGPKPLYRWSGINLPLLSYAYLANQIACDEASVRAAQMHVYELLVSSTHITGRSGSYGR